VKLLVQVAGATLEVETGEDGVQLVGEPNALVRRVRPGLYRVSMGGRSYEVVVDLAHGGGAGGVAAEGTAQVDGVFVPLAVLDARQRAMAAVAREGGAGSSAVVEVKAPMPGRIVAVPVQVGEHVERGQTVVVLEAMKMESSIAAPQAGTVEAVLVIAGQAVQQRHALVRLRAG
jgi:biotin carboxyl carrier protein